MRTMRTSAPRRVDEPLKLDLFGSPGRPLLRVIVRADAPDLVDPGPDYVVPSVVEGC